MVPDVSLEDYLLEGVRKFDAHTWLATNGKYCVYMCLFRIFRFYQRGLDVGLGSGCDTGCRHFEVFERSDQDFDQEVFQVGDASLKQVADALFDWIWGPHGRSVTR